jgi:hypothetical protein
MPHRPGRLAARRSLGAAHLREATVSGRRFDQFRERLGIADNILADRLLWLTRPGPDPPPA